MSKTKADALQQSIQMKSVRSNLDSLAVSISAMKGVQGTMADAAFRHYCEFTKEQIKLLASAKQDFIHIDKYDCSNVVTINTSYCQTDIQNIIQSCVGVDKTTI